MARFAVASRVMLWRTRLVILVRMPGAAFVDSANLSRVIVAGNGNGAVRKRIAPLFFDPIFRISSSTGRMGHGSGLYISGRISELGENARVWGLDKDFQKLGSWSGVSQAGRDLRLRGA